MKRLLGSNRLVDRLASGAICWSKICIHRKRPIKFQLQVSSIFTGWKYLCRIFFLSSRKFFFFVKDCIEEITRFVAAVKYKFSVGNKFIEHDRAARRARCTFPRVRNRFQPQTNLWNYENTMPIKIVAMFRNLFISSFDATIPVKRAFHPALAS